MPPFTVYAIRIQKLKKVEKLKGRSGCDTGMGVPKCGNVRGGENVHGFDNVIVDNLRYFVTPMYRRNTLGDALICIPVGYKPVPLDVHAGVCSDLEIDKENGDVLLMNTERKTGECYIIVDDSKTKFKI